jgi:HEAT repeats/Putative zinc-finger
MTNQIHCDAVRDQLALLLYGELNFDEEERVDQHIDSCAACRTALDRQKALHAAIDDIAVTPSPALLSNCRDTLFEALDWQDAAPVEGSLTSQTPHTEPPHESWWSQVLSSFEGKWNMTWNLTWMRPAGAFALLALGFLTARVVPYFGIAGTSNGQANYSAMDLANIGATQVRNVQEDADGRVNIVLNETRQRTVSGNMQDAMIRNLLVAAAKGSSDPGLRAETVTILVNGADSADVRQALVFALENDQNTVVRWRAMEGLKSYAHDPSVQTALARVLQHDINPGMRTQAIDLLTSEMGPGIDRQVVGVLQEMVNRETDPREDDAYVRDRAQRMLEAVKASAGVY